MTKLEQAARQALGALEVATTPLAKDRQEVLRAITTLREALSEVLALSAAPAEKQAAPKAAPGDALDEAMRERDDAEDFIGALLDEVLGHERPEWSNLYGRADALNDVQERMTSLHKPAVDKAWGQFQSAMAPPQQEAQEPYAYAVYFPDQPKVELVHDLDELIDDLTNRPHVVTKLYTAPQPAPAPLSESEYKRGYRDGYERRDAEVRGALV